MMTGWLERDAYVAKIRRKWRCMKVAGEGEHLTRGGGDIVYRAAESHDNDVCGHDADTHVRSVGTVEDLDIWPFGSTDNGFFKIADAETEGCDHDEGCNTIEE